MTAPYHLALGGADVTMSAEQIRAAYQERSITLETKVWRDGLEEWLPLADLAPELRLSRPALEKPRPTHSPCTRGAYMAWAFFFGMLGIHNFYAGYIGTAVCQLAVNLALGAAVPGGSDLSTLAGMGLFLMWIWTLCEMCLVDRDGHGRKFRE